MARTYIKEGAPCDSLLKDYESWYFADSWCTHAVLVSPRYGPIPLYSCIHDSIHVLASLSSQSGAALNYSKPDSSEVPVVFRSLQ